MDLQPRRSGSAPRSIYLVSCVAAKQAEPSEARSLYLSPLFTKARAYVTANFKPGDAWFILSAKYHLVSPEAIIAPYDQTLNTMPHAERSQWADTVIGQLAPYLQSGDRVIFLAGARYRARIENELRNRQCVVSVPMAGLGIGRQLQWLSRAIQGDLHEAA